MFLGVFLNSKSVYKLVDSLHSFPYFCQHSISKHERRLWDYKKCRRGDQHDVTQRGSKKLRIYVSESNDGAWITVLLLERRESRECCMLEHTDLYRDKGWLDEYCNSTGSLRFCSHSLFKQKEGHLYIWILQDLSQWFPSRNTFRNV